MLADDFLRKLPRLCYACEEAFIKQDSSVYPKLLDSVRSYIEIANSNYNEFVRAQREINSNVEFQLLLDALLDYESKLANHLPMQAPKRRL